MWYLEVLVADASYHKPGALTYSSAQPAHRGSVVQVPLRNKIVLGVVLQVVQKPNFDVKDIEYLPDLPPLPSSLMSLMDWMKQYYPAPLGTTLQLFLPKRLPREWTAAKTPFVDPAPKLPPLTDDQERSLASITSPGLHLLHGETGTGKTRVYIELAKRALNQDKSSLILTPEIGLTSQLADNFKKVFGERVVVAHSGLSETARQNLWAKLLTATQPMIVIGTRSALFAPVKELGLIVVDESHEPSYKQDQSPYYQASVVAAKLASLHKATLVLGSATPLVADYYIAQAKQRPIIRMRQIAGNVESDAASVAIVDLRDRKQFSKSPHLSDTLIAAAQECLEKKEQVLLFLNRRGTARVIFCDHCGWQAACPHCDLPLVYHGDSHTMRCHSCSYKAPSPSSCPTCRHAEVVFASIGTKAIVTEVQRLFPEAVVMRFDTDNKKSERLEMHYDALHAGKVDILVGTQTLAKGLDLPRLGLVGVLVADTSLSFPDFSAQERTYQLLTQVLGRVGRGHRSGAAVIQTYNPKSALLQAIVNKDWDLFYNSELHERQQFTFPPYCYLLKLTCKRATSIGAQKAATTLATELGAQAGLTIEGPTPSFHEKIQDKFAWQLIVKAKQRGLLTQTIANLPSGWSYDLDPLNLL